MNEETPERNQEMSEIKRYRKKPVVIEAVQWDGTSGGANTVIDWISGNEGCARYHCAPGGCTGTEEGHRVAIETLEGTMSADAGDFIIRGVQGEFYPCKPDIFEKTYEKYEDSVVPRLTEEQAAIMSLPVFLVGRLNYFISTHKKSWIALFGLTNLPRRNSWPKSKRPLGRTS